MRVQLPGAIIWGSVEKEKKGIERRREKMGWVLEDVYAEKLSGLENEFYGLKLATDIFRVAYNLPGNLFAVHK